jgi:putative phage-type endonuclease
MLINQDFTWGRTKYLGGSDIGAILGLSQYRTPLQVWQEKVGQESPKADSMPLRFGSFAEAFIASEYARQTGQAVVEHPEPFIHPEHPFLAGHIDRFVMDEPDALFHSEGVLATKTLLECKTASHYVKNQWGEAGTDEVPLNYLVQCAWYLLLTGCERADLAVFFSSTDFRIYTIHKDLELESTLLEKALAFWNNYVLSNTPPPPVSEADCKLLYKQSKTAKCVEADSNILASLNQLPKLNETISECEERISLIKQAVMEHMQDADTLTLNGATLATWKAPKPSYKLDSKKLFLDHPELASQYQVAIANSRRLVIKEAVCEHGGQYA